MMPDRRSTRVQIQQIVGGDSILKAVSPRSARQRRDSMKPWIVQSRGRDGGETQSICWEIELEIPIVILTDAPVWMSLVVQT